MLFTTLLTTIIGCLTTASLSSASLAQRTYRSATSLDDPLKIPGESPLELCPGDHHNDIVTIDRVDLLPNPPRPGQFLLVFASGDVLKTIFAGAYVNVTVKYGPIKILTTQADLCEQLQNVDMSCPVKPGHVEITRNVTIPAEIPPGKYYVVANVHNGDDEIITCLTATVAFSRSSFSLTGLEL